MVDCTDRWTQATLPFDYRMRTSAAVNLWTLLGRGFNKQLHPLFMRYVRVRFGQRGGMPINNKEVERLLRGGEGGGPLESAVKVSQQLPGGSIQKVSQPLLSPEQLAACRQFPDPGDKNSPQHALKVLTQRPETDGPMLMKLETSVALESAILNIPMSLSPEETEKQREAVAEKVAESLCEVGGS